MSIIMQTVKVVRLLGATTLSTITLPTVSARVVAPRDIAGYGTLLYYLEAVTAGSIVSRINGGLNLPLSTGLAALQVATTGTVSVAAQGAAGLALPTMPWIAPTIAVTTGPLDAEISWSIPMLSLEPRKLVGSLEVRASDEALGTFANALIPVEAWPFSPLPLRNCPSFIFIKGDRTVAQAALAAANIASGLGVNDATLQSMPYQTNTPTMARMRVAVDSGSYPNNQFQTIAFQLFGTRDWSKWVPTGAFFYLPGGTPAGHFSGLVNSDSAAEGSGPWVDITTYQGLTIVAMAPSTLGAVTGSLRTYITLDFAL